MTVRVSRHHRGQTLYLSPGCGIPPPPLRYPPLKIKHLLMGRLVIGSFQNVLAEPRGTAKTLEITAPKLCEQCSVTQMRKLPVYKLPIKICPVKSSRGRVLWVVRRGLCGLCGWKEYGTKNEHELCLHKLFWTPPGVRDIPAKFPGYPRFLSSKPKEDKLSREGTKFSTPTPSRGRPPSHRAVSGPKKLIFVLFFLA